MKYSFDCPAGDLHETVEAQNEQEAVEMLTDKAMRHASTAHPDMMRNPQQIRELVKQTVHKV